jgi:hypothetical protein
MAVDEVAVVETDAVLVDELVLVVHGNDGEHVVVGHVTPGCGSQVELRAHFGEGLVPALADAAVEVGVDGRELVGEADHGRLANGPHRRVGGLGIARHETKVGTSGGAFARRVLLDLALVVAASTAFDDGAGQVLRGHRQPSNTGRQTLVKQWNVASGESLWYDGSL